MSDDIYNSIRIIGDIIMFSVLKTLFFSAKQVTDKVRKILLITTVLMIISAVYSIAIDCNFIYLYMDKKDFFCLFTDILSLYWYGLVYIAIYFKKRITNRQKWLALSIFLLLFCLSIYYFIMDFVWLPTNGWLVFSLWFIFNSMSLSYDSIMSYVCIFGEVKYIENN